MRAAVALALTLVVVLSLAAAPAGARVVATYDTPLHGYLLRGYGARGPGELVAGPVLAGDRVVWAQGAPRDGVAIRSVSAAGGGAIRTLATLPGLAPGG